MIPKRHILLSVILVVALNLTFSAVQAVDWHHVETWTFRINKGWNHVETWAFNLETTVVTITLQTDPAGLQVRLDSGIWYTSPKTYTVDSGSTHSVECENIHTDGGTRYVWLSWNDSGANPHNVAPTVNTTYTASYKTRYYFTVTSAYDAPTGQGWYDSGTSTVHSTVTSPSGGYVTTGWTGTGSLSSGGTHGSTDTGVFTILEPSSCTWNWEAMAWYLVESWSFSLGSTALWHHVETWTFNLNATQYANVTITITGGGTTDPSAGNYVHTWLLGSDLYVTAYPSSGWVYSEMKRNGAGWTTDNPGEFLNLAETELIEVVFVEAKTWKFVESWSFTLNSTGSWCFVETWNFTLLSMSQWSLVETWNFTLNSTASWTIVETWNFTMTTEAISWNHVETWNFTLSPPAFIFHGLFDESTGCLYPPSERAVNVTAYYSDGNTTRTFEVNGTYTFYSTSHPLYFHFELGVHDREYWVCPDETDPIIYIFNQSLTTYTISFLDLAGALTDHPFVEAERYINGTLMTVEKRKVDVENKIVMSLVNGVKYTITLQDGASYTFGDLLMTGQITIQLTLKGIEFPKETLLTYKYVRIYGLRVFDTPNGTITITYQDILNMTASVKIYINYKNGTNIYTYTETTDSFNHEWSNALNNTDYTVVCTIDHARYGVYNWRQYFPLHLSIMPWSLDWLGTSLPFNTAYLIPAFLILFVGGCFSVINAETGAFMMVVVAIIIAYMGWLPIPSSALVVAFTLALLMGIIYAKRKVLT